MLTRVFILIILSSLLVGCYFGPSLEPVATIPPSPPTSLPEIDPSETGLINGKVFITGMYSGAVAEQLVEFQNGTLEEKTFKIELVPCIEESLYEGYVDGLKYARLWTSFPDILTIPPKSKSGIVVVLDIPSGTKVPDKLWEFRIRFTEIEKEFKMVQVALESRFFVSMR